MRTPRWPKIATHQDKSLHEHAEALRYELEAINTFARAKASSQVANPTLPHSLKDKISRGIEKGVCELVATGTLTYKQTTVIRDTILRHITNEASAKAQDRVPLNVFTRILDSYSGLLLKLWSFPGSHQHTAVDRPVPLPAGQMVIWPSNQDKEPNNPDAINLRGSDLDVHSEAQALSRTLAKSLKDEQILTCPFLHIQDTMSGLEISSSVDEGYGRNSKPDGTEEGANNETALHESKTHKGNGVEKDHFANIFYFTDTGKGLIGGGNEGDDPFIAQASKLPTHSTHHPQENPQGREMESEATKNVQRDSRSKNSVEHSRIGGVSSPAQLHVADQKAINCLNGMSDVEIFEVVNDAFRQFNANKPDVMGHFILKDVELGTNGNILVRLEDTDPKLPVSQKWLKAWGHLIRKTLCPILQSYEVETEPIDSRGIVLRSRRSKSTIISQLTAANMKILPSLVPLNGITDLKWQNNGLGKEKRSFSIAFATARQANEALDLGIHWEGKLHTCKPSSKVIQPQQCIRCQSFGHLIGRCEAAVRCGICAQTHCTSMCKSENQKCVNCGGAHLASAAECPQRKVIKVNPRFFRFEENPMPGIGEPACQSQPGRSLCQPEVDLAISNSSASSAANPEIPMVIKSEEDSVCPITEANSYSPNQYNATKIKDEDIPSGEILTIRPHWARLQSQVSEMEANAKRLDETGRKRTYSQATDNGNRSFPTTDTKRSRSSQPNTAFPGLERLDFNRSNSSPLASP